jgi:hypothetical protein
MGCPYKKSEFVVCADMYDEEIFCLTTIGKIYEVIITRKTPHEILGIESDNGWLFIPHWDYFISLKEYRKQKLLKLQNKMKYGR